MSARTYTNKRIANVLLIVLAVKILGLTLEFFEAKYQLVSPLVPKDTIIDIVAPYLFIAVISTIALIAALIFYIYSKYIITIVICSCTILLPISFYYLFFSA